MFAVFGIIGFIISIAGLFFQGATIISEKLDAPYVRPFQVGIALLAPILLAGVLILISSAPSFRLESLQIALMDQRFLFFCFIIIYLSWISGDYPDFWNRAHPFRLYVVYSGLLSLWIFSSLQIPNPEESAAVVIQYFSLVSIAYVLIFVKRLISIKRAPAPESPDE